MRLLNRGNPIAKERKENDCYGQVKKNENQRNKTTNYMQELVLFLGSLFSFCVALDGVVIVALNR